MRSFIAIALVLIIGTFFGYSYIKKQGVFSQSDKLYITEGDFVLRNQNGDLVSSSDMLGKYTMILFGFSRCPRICPNQLAIVSAILEEVNDTSLQAFFITIDPQHDTVDILKLFHEQFDQRIQMLTGYEGDIKRVIDNYKVYVSNSDKVEEINHSTVVYIMDKAGKYLDHMNLAILSANQASDYIRSIIQDY